jgi:hypothetical protein
MQTSLFLQGGQKDFSTLQTKISLAPLKQKFEQQEGPSEILLKAC